MTGKFTSRWPGPPAPVSTTGPRPHPSRHGSETASPHPVPCQKDVRRGVRRRDRGQRPTATKEPDPKPLRRRGAAAVAGSAGPGFHNWPSGHIPQDTAPKPLLRIRSHAKKTFGEAFGAATGVSDPRRQKIRIRNNYAGKLTSRRGHGIGNTVDEPGIGIAVRALYRKYGGGPVSDTW